MSPFNRARQLLNEKYAIILIIIVAALLFFHDLGKKSLWLDEGSSIKFAEQNFISIIVHPDSGGGNPFGYYLLLHYWISVFGKSEAAVRSMSALFALLSVYLVFLTGKELLNMRTGLIGAALMTFSLYLVRYSQEARMYSMLLALSLLSTLYFIKSIKSLKNNRIKEWLLYSLFTLFGLYTHYFMFFVLVSQVATFALLLLFFHTNKRTLKHFVFVLVFIAVLYLPWIIHELYPRFIASDKPYNFWQAAPTFSMIMDLFNRFTNYLLGSNYMPLFLAMLLCLVAVRYFLLFTKDNTERHHAIVNNAKNDIFLFAFFLVPIVLVFALSLYRPIFAASYMIIILPWFFLLVARAIGAMRHTPLIIVLVALFGLASFAKMVSGANDKESWRSAAKIIDYSSDENDIVLVSLGEHMLDYYSSKNLTVMEFGSKEVVPRNMVTKIITRNPDRVFIIYLYDSGRNRLIVNELSGKYLLAEEYHLESMDVLVLESSYIHANKNIATYFLTPILENAHLENGVIFLTKNGSTARYTTELENGVYALQFYAKGSQPCVFIWCTIGNSDEKTNHRIALNSTSWTPYNIELGELNSTTSIVWYFNDDLYLLAPEKNATIDKNAYITGLKMWRLENG
ncbi:MAG: glycosyltransferase family 39 protein [Candidatus Woesearchaeota archaeon]